MFTNFKVNQAATFDGVAFLACQPKCAFKSTVQLKTDDQVPKWEVQVIAMFRSAFRGVQSEVLKVGVISHHEPGQGVMPYTPIELVDFEVGVMEKTKKNPETGEEKSIGVQVWYRASEIRPIAATGAKQRGEQAA